MKWNFKRYNLPNLIQEEKEIVKYYIIIKLNEYWKFFPQRKYQTKWVQPIFKWAYNWNPTVFF